MIAFSSLALHAEAPCESQIINFDSCPTAFFKIVNNGVEAGTPVLFQNESSSGTSYLWDFGDGNTSTLEYPTHVYAAPGNYTARLVVIGNGCTSEFIGTEDVVQM